MVFNQSTRTSLTSSSYRITSATVLQTMLTSQYINSVRIHHASSTNVHKDSRSWAAMSIQILLPHATAIFLYVRWQHSWMNTKLHQLEALRLKYPYISNSTSQCCRRKGSQPSRINSIFSNCIQYPRKRRTHRNMTESCESVILSTVHGSFQRWGKNSGAPDKSKH